MENRYVFHFCGGVKSGVFSAGVAAGLIESGFERGYEIESMYGSSAGAFTEAYYASKQPLPMGPSIYWEDLKENFILGWNIPFGTFQRFCSSLFGCYPGELKHAVNIDLLISIVREGGKALDIETMRKCPFPLFTRVWDLKNKKFVFIDLRVYHDPVKLLKAAVSIVPYYFSSEDLDGRKCVDFCFADTLCLDLIAERHPDSKIIFVTNHKEMNGVLLKVCRYLEGVVANWCFKDIDKEYLVRGVLKFHGDMERIRSNPNMLLVSPPKDMSVKPFTNNPEKLIAAYEAGKKEAWKIIEFARAR